MEDDGVDPNTYTYTALITACAKAAGTRLGVQAVDQGLDLLGQMRERAIEADTVTYNALLDACAKAAAAERPTA
jgi:PPR repeat.